MAKFEQNQEKSAALVPSIGSENLLDFQTALSLLRDAKQNLEGQTLIIARLREDVSIKANYMRAQKREIEELKSELSGLRGQWNQTDV
jgi:hypothetical protein